jgi:hypothetical protein
MGEMKNKSAVVYGLLSVISPFVIVAGVIAYQTMARSNIAKSAGPEDTLATTLMDFGDAMQLLTFIIIGCIIGLVLAILSLATPLRSRVASIAGYLGIVINVLPLLYLLLESIKERLS